MLASEKCGSHSGFQPFGRALRLRSGPRDSGLGGDGAGSGSGATSGSFASGSTEATTTASTGLAQCGTDGNDFCLHIPPGWMVL